jgi:hypothetical protein
MNQRLINVPVARIWNQENPSNPYPYITVLKPTFNISVSLGPINNRMHNRADVASREVCRGRRNFSARLHILDDLIYIITFMNNDLGYSKAGQISRDAQFGVFQLR